MALWGLRFGVSAATICDIESGRRRLSPRLFKKIKAVLTDVEIEDFKKYLSDSALAEYFD